MYIGTQFHCRHDTDIEVLAQLDMKLEEERRKMLRGTCRPRAWLRMLCLYLVTYECGILAPRAIGQVHSWHMALLVGAQGRRSGQGHTTRMA